MVILRNLLLLVAMVGAVRFLLPPLPRDSAGPMRTPAAIHAAAVRDPLDSGAVCFDRVEMIDSGYATARVSDKSPDAYGSATRARLDALMACLLERNRQGVCDAGVRALLAGEIRHYFAGAHQAADEASAELDRLRSQGGLPAAESPDTILRLYELRRGAHPLVVALVRGYVASGRLGRQDFAGFLGLPRLDPALEAILGQSPAGGSACGQS